ncbi:MAG: hypothetical protein H6842_06800 [Rhodospirillaceae bacterium]|nr:hypothetical protein [Rhodospirillaceae bacterium]
MRGQSEILSAPRLKRRSDSDGGAVGTSPAHAAAPRGPAPQQPTVAGTDYRPTAGPALPAPAVQQPGQPAVPPRGATGTYADTGVRPPDLTDAQWAILQATGPGIRDARNHRGGPAATATEAEP